MSRPIAEAFGIVFNAVMPQLDPTERLEVLRQMDTSRRWYSILDKRVCAICEKTLSGGQIEITGAPGAYNLHCPTRGCSSNINHWWFLHQLGDAKAAARRRPVG